MEWRLFENGHCVKSVQVRSFSWSIFSCILTKYRKIRARKNSLFGHFSSSESLKEGFCLFQSKTRCSYEVWYSHSFWSLIFILKYSAYFDLSVRRLVVATRVAAVWRRSVKKVFLKISQNSQENTCARVSFLISEIFKNTYFHRTPLVDAFERCCT